jgi:hypothetical protein
MHLGRIRSSRRLGRGASRAFCAHVGRFTAESARLVTQSEQQASVQIQSSAFSWLPLREAREERGSCPYFGASAGAAIGAAISWCLGRIL